MANKWTETKRESKSFDNGVLTVITEEPLSTKFLSQDKKDLIDIIVKTVGAASIFIPLFLLYFQYKHENEKNRNEELTQIFINFAVDIEVTKNSLYSSKEFDSASENLLFKYPAKIAVFKIEELNKHYDEIYKNFKYYKSIRLFRENNADLQDGFVSIYRDIHQHYLKKGSMTEFSFGIQDMTVADKIKQIEKYIPIYYNYAMSRYPYLNTDLKDISQIYKSDSTLSKLNAYCDTLLGCSLDIYQELNALKLYLVSKDTNEENRSYFEDYLGDDNYGKTTHHSMNKMLEKLKNGESKLEINLNNSRDAFQKKLLSFINN